MQNGARTNGKLRFIPVHITYNTGPNRVEPRRPGPRNCSKTGQHVTDDELNRTCHYAPATPSPASLRLRLTGHIGKAPPASTLEA